MIGAAAQHHYSRGREFSRFAHWSHLTNLSLHLYFIVSKTGVWSTRQQITTQHRIHPSSITVALPAGAQHQMEIKQVSLAYLFIMYIFYFLIVIENQEQFFIKYHRNDGIFKHFFTVHQKHMLSSHTNILIIIHSDFC